MKSKIPARWLLLVTFSLINSLAYSQTITISGPSSSSPGVQETYTASFDYSLNPYTTLTWTVSGGTIISQVINPTAQSIYCVVEWGITSSGNLSLYDDVQSVTGEIPVDICGEADCSPPVTLCAGECAVIGVTPQPNCTYLWSPTTGLNDPTIAQPTACPTTTTTYTVTMTPQNGCPATQCPVVMTVKPTPSITPTGPIDYFVPLDASCPYKMTLTSSLSSGNQWFRNSQPIAGASSQNINLGFSTGQCVAVDGVYQTIIDGCASNSVIFNIKHYGYGNFGEEVFNFGAKFNPASSPGFYCLNSTGIIKNIDLGPNTTYTWEFINISNPSGTPNITLNTQTYSPSSSVADVNIGNDPYSGVQIKGIADKNGIQSITDYLVYQSQYSDPVFGNNYTTCSGMTANVYLLNSSNSGFYESWRFTKPGGSNFDWEDYEFGPNSTLLNYSGYLISTNPLILHVPGGNEQGQPIQVQFSGSSYIHKTFYHNNQIDGCAEEYTNVIASVPGCLRTERVTESELLKSLKVQIYPNPSQNTITINSPSTIQKFEIISSSGAIVLQQNGFNLRTIIFPINKIPSGIYMCKVYTAGKTETKKLIIQKQ